MIPKTFCDALTVREEVFVKEMGAVPLIHHTDTDDARSWHWVLYSASSDGLEIHRKPIGTVRLIPYPHHLHPNPGDCYKSPGPDTPSEDAAIVFLAPAPPSTLDRETSLHDGKEPYLKIGRMCVLKEFRRMGLADSLIRAALTWAAENPKFSKDGEMPWKGLVCAHAQEKAVTMWQRNGFVVDDIMGLWQEAGINHYGLFSRVQVKS